jgi:hypothetical protein
VTDLDGCSVAFSLDERHWYDTKLGSIAIPIVLFREKVGDDADHWYFLCPRHWQYHRWLRITIGIEAYISQYIWRGFCWHAPWDQLKRLFIRNPKGVQ